MSKSARADQTRCPTCPDGRCPPINTRPTSPEPAAERITAAERAIPDVLIEHFRADDRYDAVASELVERLRRRKYGGHLRPAAEWAIHQLVLVGKLSAHMKVKFCRPSPVGRSVRRFVDGELEQVKHEPFVPVYSKIDDPARFDAFVVRAEEVLWSSWPAKANEQPVETPRSYLPGELCKELDIRSTKTLNKYAKQAGVKTPRRGQRDHRYTMHERQLIYQKMANKAPSSLAQMARELLDKIQPKSN